jgi:wyosine [tRNA(Phe)-imidazoG37] synthetase (radical SAM superfamily)
MKNETNNGIGFLKPDNWVFHDSVVEKVLAGDYFNIMPYSAEFVTTMNCSNRCLIPCSYLKPKIEAGVWDKNNFKNPETHMPNIEFAKELLDKLIYGGIKGITFTGGGEPFYFKGLEELISHTSKKGVDSVLYTNGNSCPEKQLAKIIEASPLLARVSLNCGTPGIYDKFHQPIIKNGLVKTLNTIKVLARGSLSNPRMSVGVGVVINEINKDDLMESAKRIREITDETGGGIEFITYRPAFNNCGSEQLTRDLLNKTYEIVETQVRDILKDSGVKVANVTCRYEALKEDTRDYAECRAMGLYAELAPSGKLHTCCDRNCNRAYVIGDLKEKSLAEIWASDERREVINRINKNMKILCPPGCKPHETNRQFEKIEQLRSQGKINEIKSWINEQRKQPKPKMVNF